MKNQQSDHLTLLQELKFIYQSLFLEIKFDEIEHIPNEMIAQNIKIQQNCLCIRHSFFDKYYGVVMKQILHTNALQIHSRQANNMYAEVILIMNGQNDRAWSIKRYLLLQNRLDITRQLRFNASICYKNKKSFLYYQFRLRLIHQLLINQPHTKQQLIGLYKKQNELITKILSRFHRNYQCWLFRIKLYQLLQNYFKQEIVVLQIQLLHGFIQRNPNDYSAYSRLINIISKNQVNIGAEYEWIKQLHNFCMVAYQKESSYKHIITYRDYLSQYKNKS